MNTPKTVVTIVISTLCLVLIITTVCLLLLHKKPEQNDMENKEEPVEIATKTSPETLVVVDQQEKQYKTLRLIFDELMDEIQEVNAQFDMCIMYGTLLGWFRERDVILGDNDVDICILSKDVPAFEDFIRKTYLNIIFDETKSIYQILPNTNESNMKISKHKHGMIDIYILEDHGGYLYDTWNKWVYRKEDFFPYHQATFLGHRVNIPNNHTTLLCCLYGIQFMTPIAQNYSYDQRFPDIPYKTRNYKEKDYLQVWSEDIDTKRFRYKYVSTLKVDDIPIFIVCTKDTNVNILEKILRHYTSISKSLIFSCNTINDACIQLLRSTPGISVFAHNYNDPFTHVYQDIQSFHGKISKYFIITDVNCQQLLTHDDIALLQRRLSETATDAARIHDKNTNKKGAIEFTDCAIYAHDVFTYHFPKWNGLHI